MCLDGSSRTSTARKYMDVDWSYDGFEISDHRYHHPKYFWSENRTDIFHAKSSYCQCVFLLCFQWVSVIFFSDSVYFVMSSIDYDMFLPVVRPLFICIVPDSFSLWNWMILLSWRDFPKKGTRSTLRTYIIIDFFQNWYVYTSIWICIIICTHCCNESDVRIYSN